MTATVKLSGFNSAIVGEGEGREVALIFDFFNGHGAIDVAEDEMSSETVIGAQGKFGIDLRAGSEFANGRFSQGFAADVEGYECTCRFGYGQADAVYCDAVAGLDLINELAEVNCEQGGIAAFDERLYRANLLYYSCKHSD
jgi:hypothetical protein